MPLSHHHEHRHLSPLKRCLKPLFRAGVSAAALSLMLCGPVRAQSVTVTGNYLSETGEPSGANWASTQDLAIGNSGIGAMVIKEGARARNKIGQIGRFAASDGSVSVSGGGSEWVNDASLFIGQTGKGSLVIETGAKVSNSTGFIGSGTGSTGTVTVSGAGSVWTNSDVLRVGHAGAGTLFIETGGRTTNTSGYIGVTAGSVGVATVTGAGSEWINSGLLHIGAGGQGSLTVSAGGKVGNTNASIGVSSGSNGSVTVTGAGSIWASSDPLRVGDAGTGSLLVEAGGHVSSKSGSVAYSTGSVGIATVTGEGSVWTNHENLHIGTYGQGTLIISAGGRVEDTSGHLGRFAVIGGDTGGEGFATVTGAGSLWRNTQNLTVGTYARGTLTISAGGRAESKVGHIGYEARAQGTATVTGAGSKWVNSSSLNVGLVGNGTLIVEAGGGVENTLGTIGSNAGSVGSASVTGTGSAWHNSQALLVGRLGQGELQIAGGGSVSATAVQLGVETAGGGKVTLSGSASARSQLETGQVEKGRGAGAFNFDGGLLRLTQDQASLFAGFTAGAVSFDTGGGLIDTQDFTVASAASFSGSGGLVKLGGGTLSLSGVSSFTGATTVEAGTLNVNGTLASAVSVDAGALISGTGTIGGLRLHSGGIASPGNSIGTLNVDGDVVFNAGSIYAVELEAPDRADRIAASGTVTINGGALHIEKLSAEADYDIGQTYTIITAAGGVLRNGDFSLANPFLFLSSQLEYGANHVAILLREKPESFATQALTENQRQSALGLDGLVSGGDAFVVHNQLLFLTDGAEARRAFDLSSGEVHVSARHVIDADSRLFNTSLLRQGAAGHEAAGAASQHYRNIWAAPLGGFGRVDGDGNAAGLDWRQGGIAGGYETAMDAASGTGIAGLGLGYLRSHGNLDGRLSSLDADSFHLGVYGSWVGGPWRASAALSYAGAQVNTDRRIAFGSLDRRAEADYWTHSLRLSGEVSHDFALGDDAVLAPLVSFDASRASHGGFSETGADALNLRVDSGIWNRFDTGLGLALSHGVDTESGRLAVDARAVWEHAFGDRAHEQGLALAGSTAAFSVRGPESARDRLRLGAGLGWDISDRTRISARYDGLVAEDQTQHSASVRFNIRF